MEGKQTISELSHRFGVNKSTIKRRLKDISKSWEQPTIEGCGYVHMDATYWGERSWGVLLALDEHSGFPLYLAFIENETASDYEKAIRSIEERGYTIFGIIIDGKKSLFTLFSDYQIQMCQFHMKQVIRRYLTQNPRLKAARGLKGLLDTLTVSSGRDFKINYAQWKEKMERHACKALSAEMWKKPILTSTCVLRCTAWISICHTSLRFKKKVVKACQIRTTR